MAAMQPTASFSTAGVLSGDITARFSTVPGLSVEYLMDTTEFIHSISGDIDRMENGSLRYRRLGSASHCLITCDFKPMDADTSQAFKINTIAPGVTQEFTFNGTTYRGNINPAKASKRVRGPWHYWTLEFSGEAV